MTSEAITTAIRSVLGYYASPEKIADLDAALRPIYGREAAELAYFAIPIEGESARQARASRDDIRTAFGVTDNG